MIQNKPKITIITASYNSQNTIENTIKSVLSQSYDNIEYVIIDGNSKDSTCSIIGEYRDNLDVYIHEPDDGIYSAWNKGIRNSTGDYIFFLNSDDVLYESNVIQDIAQYIKINNYPEAVYARLIGYEPETGYSYLDGRKTQITDFLYKMHFCTLAAFVKRSVYEEIGYYREDYRISSDYDWAIRLFKVKNDTELLFFDRVIIKFSVAGCSNNNYEIAYKEISLIVREHFPFFSYFKHLIYAKSLLLVKQALPYARATGLLGTWRKIKQKRL